MLLDESEIWEDGDKVIITPTNIYLLVVHAKKEANAKESSSI